MSSHCGEMCPSPTTHKPTTQSAAKSYFAGGAAGAPGIAGTPAGAAGMPAGGAGIVWPGRAPPLFMMLREPPLPEK